MLVAFSVCRRDEANAMATLAWAHQLDGQLPYDCILTVANGVCCEPPLEAAKKLFRKVTVLDSAAPETWPQGKNAAFQQLVWHLYNEKITEPFFWWEPDAIPLKKGWLSTIEQAHLAGGKPFSGFVHPALQYLECVAVYPANYMDYSQNGMLCRAAGWDVCSKEVVPLVNPLNHLMQFVHDVDGFPPTFSDAESRLLLHPNAVLFHKNKDGTLVQQLSKGTVQRLMEKVREVFTPKAEAPPKERIVVVLPVCAKDIDQAIHHARWLKTLGRFPNDAVLACDFETPHHKTFELKNLLDGCFRSVKSFLYPNPPDITYPAVANWAFARCAEMMANQTAPWLWLEADAVVLSKDWLDILQKEYEAGGKAFMGPIIKEAGHGHANGSCVYPADAVRRIPKALKSKDAWDWAMRDEMMTDCHDGSHVMAHVWGVVNGQPSQTNGATPPMNFTPDLMRRCIPKGAVMMHRAKDTSLVELLMAGGGR